MDQEKLSALIASGQVWKTFDTINAQLTDLIKTRNPKRRKNADVEDLIPTGIRKITNGQDLRTYGNWIYYPWSGHLVHLLPEAEFRELRLSRNQYKITAAEQEKLSRLCIGIIGLSVGNAIANTIALEGVGGGLKLADFDELELSNMNRIRAGVQDLGLSKTVLAARQIFELNPYAHISLFQDGITEDNIDDFLTGAHPVDLVVDECDDLRMKVLIRERARALQLPVLMETSDRGMLDVERFDLEPDRPLFHGFLGDTGSSDVPASLTNEEKVGYALAIFGDGTLSSRLGASFLEIGETIATWPQLGSDVTLGGASICAAIRHLALGKKLFSGRKLVDMEAILLDGKQGQNSSPAKRSTTDGGEQSSPSPADENTAIPPLIREIVSMGTLAPSGGNCQPWKFYYDAPDLWVVHDKERSKNLLDIANYASYLAIGAAIKNMEIAASENGLRLEAELFPLKGNSSIVARLRFERSQVPLPAAAKALYPYIKLRVTNRKHASRVPLSTSQEAQLLTIVGKYNCRLQLVEEEPRLAEMASIIGRGDRIRFLCDKLHREMMAEVRWTPQEAEQTRDGIDIATMELNGGQYAGIRLLSRPDIAQYLRQLNAGNKLTEISEKPIKTASAVGLISVQGEQAADFLRGGKAIEHMWLKACGLGLAIQPMTALLSMFKMLNDESRSVFNPAEIRCLEDLLERFQRVFPPKAGYTPLMFFRLSRASAPEVRSLRRPLEEVLFYGIPDEVFSNSLIRKSQ